MYQFLCLILKLPLKLRIEEKEYKFLLNKLNATDMKCQKEKIIILTKISLTIPLITCVSVSSSKRTYLIFLNPLFSTLRKYVRYYLPPILFYNISFQLAIYVLATNKKITMELTLVMNENEKYVIINQ